MPGAALATSEASVAGADLNGSSFDSAATSDLF
jgi:hypothetical protein